VQFYPDTAKPPVHYIKEELLSGSSELIGRGAFGRVYKGVCVDGKAIVVKVLHTVCPIEPK
jgi:hypothetical protein